MLNNMSFHDLLCLQPLSPMGLRRLFRFQEILLFLRTSEIHPTRFVSFLSLISVKQTRLMLGRVAMHSSLSLLSWICSVCVSIWRLKQAQTRPWHRVTDTRYFIYIRKFMWFIKGYQHGVYYQNDNHSPYLSSSAFLLCFFFKTTPHP